MNILPNPSCKFSIIFSAYQIPYYLLRNMRSLALKTEGKNCIHHQIATIVNSLPKMIPLLFIIFSSLIYLHMKEK